jgi:sugar phosphate isomerase/epimerase
MNQISLNQATVQTSTTLEVLRACAAADVRALSLWRHQYVDGDVQLTRRALEEHGISATSLCRAGFFTGTRSDAEADEDNRRAVEEAAALGAPVLVLVCGPVTSAGLNHAHSSIARGIERLLPAAVEHGVTLAVEPFHPMFAAERSAIVTLGQATRLVTQFATANLGLAVDTYHVWWDPDLQQALRDAAEHTVAVHVADWLVPTTDLLAGRGLPGDGVIDLPSLLGQLHTLGYTGPFEVEVLNRELWMRPTSTVVVEVRDRMSALLTTTASVT